MRPEEIDYSDTRKHYLDISNGEILAGQDDRRRYIEAGAQVVHIVALGPLLRDPTPHVNLEERRYDPLDTSDWPRDKYVDFARWLYRTVDPQRRPQEKRVTKTVFKHARWLGVGPGTHAIRREFDNHSTLYQAARLGDTHAIGLYDDWDVDDAVAYIKRVGGDRRPTTTDLRRRNKNNPNNPTAEYLWDRFRHIGGFNQLVELAGYPVIKHWSHEDYIEWGVRFMRANDGQPPTARMAEYLSQRHRGPSASTIVNHFDRLSDFQAEIIPRFYQQQKESDLHRQEQLGKIESDLRQSQVPLELFSPLPHLAEDADEEERAAVRQELEGLYGDQTADSIVSQLGVREAIIRYAKFKVLEEVAPWMEADTRLTISRGLSERGFVSAIRKTNTIPPGDIEYAALVGGFFDDIWPDDAMVEPLKLDKGYRRYLDAIQKRDTEYRQAKKSVARS